MNSRCRHTVRWIASRIRAVAALQMCLAFVVLICSSAQANDKLLAERRARIESMSAAERDQLRRNHQRFRQLDEGRREELRRLHAEISASPERQRLTSIMQLHHQWMQSLTAGERLQLLELPADQRVRAIKKLVERQERERFQAFVQKSLSAEDREAIIGWLSQLAFERLPPHEQQRLRAIEQPMRRRMETMAVFRRRAGGMNDVRFLERLTPTKEEQKALAERLSQPAQAAITAAKGDVEKRRLIQSWVNAAIFSRRGNRPQVTQETLDQFLNQLDAAERDYLDNLPPDRKRNELEQLYMRSRMRRPGEPRPGYPPKGRRRGEND